MTLSISQVEHDLLSKRQTALAHAQTASQTAQILLNAETTAFQDVLNALVLGSGGKPDTKYTGFNFGRSVDGKYFLELQEAPIEPTEVADQG